MRSVDPHLMPDGLVTRPSGDWARKKHRFLHDYGRVALDATLGARRPKRTAAYVDLFAGPGICVDHRTADRFFGSPLSAIQLRSQRGFAFTEAHLVNWSSEQFDALEARIDRLDRAGRLAVRRDRIFTYRGDANEKVRDVLGRIHPQAYVFAFADPSRPNDLPFSTIEALRTYRGHRSVDLYTLFPLGMALSRMLGYDRDAREVNAAAVSRFFGDESWRRCETLRVNEQRRLDFARCLTAVYLERLRSLWLHADEVLNVKHKGSPLYKMCFASSHDAGKNIAQWAKRYAEQEQPSLGLGL